MEEIDDLDTLNDGMAEDVDLKPLRTRPERATVEQAANTPAGGRLARMREAGAEGRKNFISIRSPLGAAKVAMTHVEAFAALWRLSGQKRLQSTDAGVYMAELATELDQPRDTLDNVMRSLVKNQIVRIVKTAKGWASATVLYYPTELGIQLFACAEWLGDGASVQVGRTTTAWRARNQAEPQNVFRHASLLRGTKEAI